MQNGPNLFSAHGSHVGRGEEGSERRRWRRSPVPIASLVIRRDDLYTDGTDRRSPVGWMPHEKARRRSLAQSAALCSLHNRDRWYLCTQPRRITKMMIRRDAKSRETLILELRAHRLSCVWCVMTLQVFGRASSGALKMRTG